MAWSFENAVEESASRRAGTAAPARPWFPWWFVLVGTLATFVGFGPGACSSGDVEVPAVVGLTLEEAREKLTEAGLVVELGDPDPSSDKAPDTVISQEPGEKAKVDKGSVVVLTVAAAKDEVAVPAVAGLPLEEAKAMLSEAGLAPELAGAERASDVPAGTVLKQDPDKDSKVARGTRVALTVALATVTVPDVIGLSFENARAKLSEAGLEAGQGDAERTNEHQAGTVLRQEPAANKEVEKGDVVALTLAVQDAVRVPKVTDTLLAAAEAELTTAGLVPVRGRPVLKANVPKGIVVEQNPAANAEVARGKQVTLMWSAEGVHVPKIIGKRLWTNNKNAEAEVVRLLVQLRDQGFYVKFTMKQDKSKPHFTILATEPKEGALVARGTTLNLTLAAATGDQWYAGVLEHFLKEHGLSPRRPVIKLDPAVLKSIGKPQPRTTDHRLKKPTAGRN